MMGKRNDQDLRFALTDDHRVRETPEQQAFDSTSPGNAGYGCQGDDFLLKQTQRRIDSAFEVDFKSRAFFLMLRCRFGSFFGRRCVDAHHAH